MDQVMALENGGDDYITKPFHPEIVLAKIRSQLRRAYGEYANIQKERVVELKGLKLYIERLELSLGEDIVVDRKSTRLNSSHVAISYAVFCLKKKISGDDMRERLCTSIQRKADRTG